MGVDIVCRVPDASLTCDTPRQHNTHIRDLREICYPWHPWYGRRVWVHASIIKLGRAVAFCSLEDLQSCRVLEVPLWMLDVAVCCKTRASKPGFASTQSLRELKELLQAARPQTECHGVPETPRQYLLDAEGADGSIVGPEADEPTPIVRSSTWQPALDRSVLRCSTKDSAIDGTVAEAVSRKNGGNENRSGGVR